MAARPLLLVLAYAGFVSLGLPDTVLGVAWPTLRGTFRLSQAAMGAVLATAMCGYLASGLIAGRLTGPLGLGGLLAASCALVAVAQAGFAAAPVWALFPPLALVWGFGSGAIDSALNGYAARHYSVRHVNWLHACWSVGATLGPVIMTAALSRTGSYRAGYAGIAGALAAMGLAFAVTRRSWDDQIEGSPVSTSGSPTATVGAFQTLGSGRVWLQIGLFFTYTGLEAGAGQWCFTVLREEHGLGVEAAGAWTAAFWGSLLAGRVAGGFVVDRLGPDRLLRLSACVVVAGAIAFASGDGAANRVGLMLLGGALAPVYPTLMARTPARLGHAASAHAIGFQVSAATLGAAALPTGLGVMASRAGLGVVAPAVAAVAVVFLALHELLLRVTPRADR